MAKSRFDTRLASSVLTGSIPGGNPEDKVHEPPAHYQLVMPFEESQTRCKRDNLPDIEQELARLLTLDLTFKGSNTRYASHQLHAFAAKFPLQLPRLFIRALTRPGEWVLDPMAGSGTALVEAILAGRCAIGVDLDPLAVMIAKVKTTPLDLPQCARVGINVLMEARANLRPLTEDDLYHSYSRQAVAFFRYWFEEHTVNELFALIDAVNRVEDPDIQAFLKVVFSSCIITKSGGLTRARDLAHSRPHRDLNKRILISVTCPLKTQQPLITLFQPAQGILLDGMIEIPVLMERLEEARRRLKAIGEHL